MAVFTPRPSSSNSLWAVLQNRDFRFLWGAGALDNSARWMEAVVLGLLVLELTDSPFQVALLFVFRWTPMLMMALLSGMFADRANRWLVMVAARVMMWAVIATLTVLVAVGSIQPWHMYTGSLLLGWLYVLEFPSRRSFIFELVGGRQIVGAMSLETITVTLGRFIGPLSAGFIVELSGYTPAFVLLTVLNGLALVFTLKIRARFPARSSGPFNFLATAWSGVRYALGNRVIRSVLGFTLIMNAMAFSVEALFPVVARDHLGVGEGLTGLLIAAPSIGTLGTAIVIGSLSGLRYHGRVFCLGLLAQLLSLVLFALSPWYSLSFVLLLVAGLGAAGFSTMQSTIVMIAATPAMRGTALGVLGQCIGCAAIGGVVVGLVAEVLSARAAVGLSTGLGLALLVLIIPLSPLVRRPITQPEETPARAEGAAAPDPV